MFNEKANNDEKNLKEYIDKLNKRLDLEKKGKVDPVRLTICIVGGIVSIMFAGILCYTLLNSDFSLEGILSTLLAFFSIFISIFFYFKADETSTNFYKSSYEFMKDISVTLGKIEERFGEKLNSLNDKITHLDNVSSEKSVEIADEKENKEEIINELMNKANLSDEERKKYKKDIAEKEAIIERLKYEQHRAEKEAYILRSRMNQLEHEDRWEPNNELLARILNNGISEIPPQIAHKLRKLGYLDSDGNVNQEYVIKKINENTGFKF